MRTLPERWWFFLPIWFFFPASLAIVVLMFRVNLWLGFFVACVYIFLTVLAYIPIKRNALSAFQAWFWVGLGTVVIGLPGFFLISWIFHKTLKSRVSQNEQTLDRVSLRRVVAVDCSPSRRKTVFDCGWTTWEKFSPLDFPTPDRTGIAVQVCSLGST